MYEYILKYINFKLKIGSYKLDVSKKCIFFKKRHAQRRRVYYIRVYISYILIGFKTDQGVGDFFLLCCYISFSQWFLANLLVVSTPGVKTMSCGWVIGRQLNRFVVMNLPDTILTTHNMTALSACYITRRQRERERERKPSGAKREGQTRCK